MPKAGIIKAGIIRELMIRTENRVGMLADVAATIAGSGVNIKALNAFAINDEAIFRIVASDNMKAIKDIKATNIEAIERDVVAVDLENKIGTASEMTRRLKEAGINITYMYGSTFAFGTAALIVFNCNDNKKAVEVLNA